MLDIKLLRKDIGQVSSNLQRRGFNLDVGSIGNFDAQRKMLQTKLEALQNERNTKSKMIGQLKAKGESADTVLKEVAHLGDAMKEAEAQLKDVQEQLDLVLQSIPNTLHDSVPKGLNEDDNVEVRKWGEPKQFDFTPKDHVDLGEALGGIDFEMATKITGARFVVLYNQIARLHRALAQFMMDLHTTEHGYQEIYVPYLVNRESLFGTGQLPKFNEDLFHIKGEQNFSLISTGEIPVTNVMRDRIVGEEELPLKFVSHTPCFRSEAGSYGKDVRGMLRQHQFEKIELVQIVHPDVSCDVHEELTRHAETVLQRLNLPYRVMNLCAGDVGMCSAKTYDLEVWMPGQDTYREISSCSNFEAFQARRMKARFRSKENNKPQLVHTLNGSGLAIGRTLIAVIENCQLADGRIEVPEVLRSYMGGLEIIGA